MRISGEKWRGVCWVSRCKAKGGGGEGWKEGVLRRMEGREAEEGRSGKEGERRERKREGGRTWLSNCLMLFPEIMRERERERERKRERMI